MLPNDSIEQWRAVEGWPGYEVSDAGRVRSRRKRGNSGGLTDRWLMMKQLTNRKGYRFVMLTIAPRRQNFCVHQLVARSFYGRELEGQECRHLDGNPSNNALSNLQWGTAKENGQDKLRHGTNMPGERQPGAKLTDADAIEIRRRAATGEPYTVIAKSYPSVFRTEVSRIGSGERFGHLPGAIPKRNPVKLNTDAVREIRALCESGMTRADAARRFGVSAILVSQIMLRQRWAYVT